MADRLQLESDQQLARLLQEELDRRNAIANRSVVRPMDEEQIRSDEEFARLVQDRANRELLDDDERRFTDQMSDRSQLESDQQLARLLQEESNRPDGKITNLSVVRPMDEKQIGFDEQFAQLVQDQANREQLLDDDEQRSHEDSRLERQRKRRVLSDESIDRLERLPRRRGWLLEDDDDDEDGNEDDLTERSTAEELPTVAAVLATDKADKDCSNALSRKRKKTQGQEVFTMKVPSDKDELILKKTGEILKSMFPESQPLIELIHMPGDSLEKTISIHVSSEFQIEFVKHLIQEVSDNEELSYYTLLVEPALSLDLDDVAKTLLQEYKNRAFHVKHNHTIVVAVKERMEGYSTIYAPTLESISNFLSNSSGLGPVFDQMMFNLLWSLKTKVLRPLPSSEARKRSRWLKVFNKSKGNPGKKKKAINLDSNPSGKKQKTNNMSVVNVQNDRELDPVGQDIIGQPKNVSETQWFKNNPDYIDRLECTFLNVLKKHDASSREKAIFRHKLDDDFKEEGTRYKGAIGYVYSHIVGRTPNGKDIVCREWVKGQGKPEFCYWYEPFPGDKIKLLEREVQSLRSLVSKAMRSTVVRVTGAKSHAQGYPRIGPNTELIKALISFWKGSTSAAELEAVASDLKVSTWRAIASSGVKLVPSNTFSFFDHVLDTTMMLGAIPPRFISAGEEDLHLYFLLAKGSKTISPMERRQYFDTMYSYVVPELDCTMTFSYLSKKAVEEYKEAKMVNIETIPVIIGPVTYLMLSISAKEVDSAIYCSSLIEKILPIYKEVLHDLESAGATWIQIDEPFLVLHPNASLIDMFTRAYDKLFDGNCRIKCVIETYFGDLSVEGFRAVTSLKGIAGVGLDFVSGQQNFQLAMKEFPRGKYLFAGVVNGRDVWRNDLESSLDLLFELESIVGTDKLVVSTSCSLLHCPIDIRMEKNMDPDIMNSLAFSAQKLLEVNVLSKALNGEKQQEHFEKNAAVLNMRRQSYQVNDRNIYKSAFAMSRSTQRRAKDVGVRLVAQKNRLNLPMFPTTLVGSMYHDDRLYSLREQYKRQIISKDEFIVAVQRMIDKTLSVQEEIGVDVLVSGSPELCGVGSLKFFVKMLKGIVLPSKAWIQTYGSERKRPPIIYGDISMVESDMSFIIYALTKSKLPVKAILLGPVSILNSSFLRNDLDRSLSCFQIAIAIKTYVEKLEKAGISVIQINEPLLRDGMPLHSSEKKLYMDWAFRCFRTTTLSLKETTQIHSHVCSNIDLDMLEGFDADVVTVDSSVASDLISNLKVAQKQPSYDIGLGLFGMESAVPPDFVLQIKEYMKTIHRNHVWVNPNCGLVITEVKNTLLSMVRAAEELRETAFLDADIDEANEA